jgi:hypothetical protein
MTTVLVHGSDSSLEAALLRQARLELVGDVDADAFLSLGPPPRLQALAQVTPDEWLERFGDWAQQPFWAFQRWLRRALERGRGGRWVAVTTTAEYGSQGIRANAIAAGWRAGMIPEGLDPELALADTPSGRLISDDDLAATIAWLLSEEADQVNGEIVRLDGGYTITGGSRPDPRTQ